MIILIYKVYSKKENAYLILETQPTMKNQILFLFFLCSLFWTNSNAQFGEWTWMHGDSIWGSPGNYGTLGVSSPTNEPPAVYETCEWTDLNGNLWIFGGWGNST